MAAWVGSVSPGDFATGDARFDGEWLFGTWQMAGLGLLQVCIEHPEERDEFLPVVRTAISRMTDRDVRAFDTAGWNGHDALDGLSGPQGHAAYLGYLGMVLGLYREQRSDPELDRLHDGICRALARRVRESPTGLLETYRGEVYPVDNCSVAATLALHDRATGGDSHRDLLADWTARFRRTSVDPASGMLIQAVDASGAPADEPRASGTALGLYFLSFADFELSRELYGRMVAEVGAGVLGFGLIREYPRSSAGGSGDIDSGPVVFGVSFSGTGFAIAGSRIHGDRDRYVAAYRTAHLVGAPLRRGDRRGFVTGGPLGNAIMLAMLTASERASRGEGR